MIKMLKRNKDNQTAEQITPTIKCHLCPKFYCNRKHMYRHMRTNHSIDPITNEVLPERTRARQKPKKKPESREEKNTIEVNTSEYAVLKHRTPCQVCTKSFSQPRNMYQHMRRVHGLKAAPVQVARSELIRPIKRIRCQMCPRTFADAGNMYRHVRKLHGTLPRTQRSRGEFECPLCSTHFKEGHELKRHIKLAHSLSLSGDDKSECVEDYSQHARTLIKCPICDREFNRTFNMHHHLRKRHKTEPARLQLECPLCQFVCRRHSVVLRHLKKHHGLCTDREKHRFNSMADFNQWKVDLEQTENVKFVEQTKPRSIENKDHITSFLCNGVFKTGNKMRICPAHVVVSCAGEIMVNYFKTHTCKRKFGGEMERDTFTYDALDTEIVVGNQFNAAFTKTEKVYVDDQTNIIVGSCQRGAKTIMGIEKGGIPRSKIQDNEAITVKQNQNETMFKFDNKDVVQNQTHERHKDSNITLLIIRNHYECAACKEIFYQRDKLICHLTQEHLQEINVNSEALQARTVCARVPCQICSQTFSNRVNMYKHMRGRHRSEPTYDRARGDLVCPLCGAGVQFHKALIRHLEVAHDVVIEQEELLFDTLTDFEQWRSNIEREQGVYYVKRTKTKRSTIFLFCNRSGHAKTDSNKTIRMGTTCPARITLYADGTRIRAKHYKTHICTTTLCVEDKKGSVVCERCGKVVSKKNILRHYRDIHSSEVKRS